MQDSFTQKINDYIEEFFPMAQGEIISNPEEEILFSSHVTISRRTLKYIVERRYLNDNLNLSGIKNLLERARAIVDHPEVVIRNTNGRYPESSMLGGLDSVIEAAIMVVVDYSLEGEQKIITIFLKEKRQFLALIKKSP